MPLSGTIVGGPQLFTKADAVRGAITVTKVDGVVTDVVVNKPEWIPAVMVVKEDGVLKDVVLQETDTIKGITLDVKKDDKGKITEVVTTKGVKIDVTRNPAGAITDVTVKNIVKKGMWVQNAAFWYVPFLIVAFILCAIFLRSVTVPARGFKGQFEILSKKNRALTHTWNCTITYICSFGSFSGYAAAFPMMIKTIYSGFDGGPDPLKYAFFGPLIGGLVRALTGPVFDKIGGSKGMHWTTIGQILACIVLIVGGFLTPTEATWVAKFPWFIGVMLFHVPDDGHEQRGDLPSVSHSVRVFAGQGSADARLDRGVGGIRSVCLHQSYRLVHYRDR